MEETSSAELMERGDGTRRLILKVMKETGVSAQEILQGLPEAREETFQKHYGSKKKGRFKLLALLKPLIRLFQR